MQSVKQQQILGYFIEEAKEHLDTIEQGLVDLATTMSDPDRVNELFRAAHSVKGGAAMLGFDSIQKTAHHFEDCFKILKEHPVQINQRLEDLFLKGFDTLKALIEGLQGPFGLREEDAQQAVLAAEPIFVELQKYLNALISQGAMSIASTNGVAPRTQTSSQNAATLINVILKAMLQLFKQGDSSKSRQQLVALCNRLIQVSSTAQPWVAILQTAQRAIENPKNSYSALAPIVIKELKQASDLLLAGRIDEITLSTTLKQLAVAPAAPQPATQPASRPEATKEQLSIPLEPKAAAKALLKSFNKADLIEIAEFLMKAIQ